jgi:hypothetical protein
MEVSLTEKLERLRNYSTRYELAISHADGRRYLVAYSPRNNRRGLFDAVRGRGAAIVALTGADDMVFGNRAADGATVGAWTIRFTQRTQREAYIEGELSYVGDVANVASVA